EYKSIIRKLRKARPDIQISSDFIVGFPGETDKDFQDTMKLIKDVDFDMSFSFIFSPRPGTPAADYPCDIPEQVKKERLYELQQTINAQAMRYSRLMLATEQRVLVEGPSKKNLMELRARTENNRVVNFEGSADLIGQFVDVKITDVFANSLRGDQLREGIYLTERRQVEVEELDLAPVGANQANANQLQRTNQLVWKTVPVVDKTGQPIRQDNPLQQYGIQVTQVTIGDPQPEKQLDQLLADKKRLVADRIRAIQEQETSKAQAETEQLRKEIQRTREVQDAQRQKELAIISQQKEVEVARQIAEREIVEVEKTKRLAEVEKEKELAIAEANLAIQKANALSAEFEAKAILAKGRAESEVLKGKYAALGANREVYLAELNRDVANSLYNNLQNFQVQMPQNYIGGSDETGLKTNLDVITGFGALGLMDQTKKVTQQ
ncbi:2-methylthioadenine synthetase, partial [Vibrio parahaemolyticus AQ3810]